MSGEKRLLTFCIFSTLITFTGTSFWSLSPSTTQRNLPTHTLERWSTVGGPSFDVERPSEIT
jgi:hypothetical protein